MHKIINMFAKLYTRQIHGTHGTNYINICHKLYMGEVMYMTN